MQPPHQQTTVVPMQPVQPVQPYIVQPHVPQTTVNVSAIRGLSITQILIGIFSGIFGLAFLLYSGDNSYYDTSYYYYNNSYRMTGINAMACGFFIFITGILGVVSYKDPTSTGKNGLHMGFCIFSSLCGFSMTVVYGIGVSIYMDCIYRYNYLNNLSYTICYPATQKALCGILLFLGIIEFIVALTAAIYTCVFGCCGSRGCCGGTQPGTVVAPQPVQQQYVVTSSTGQQVFQHGVPVASAPQYVSTVPYYTNQPVVTSVGVTGYQQGATNVTYSAQHQAPPPYETKGNTNVP